MGTISGVCPAQNILLGSSVKTRDSCVLSIKQTAVNTLLKLELLFISANFAPMTAYQDNIFQWVAPNNRPLSLPKYALALARRLIPETTPQSIFVKSNPLAVSLSLICFPWLKFDKLAECPTSVISDDVLTTEKQNGHETPHANILKRINRLNALWSGLFFI